MLSLSSFSLCHFSKRYISLTLSHSINHYEVLGMTQKSTQGEIKAAYYKLSKMYHPDISNDSESATKFRAITEAYEVLGNLKLKKLYDKGLIPGYNTNIPKEEETDLEKFHRSRQVRHRRPEFDNEKIYDFDAWTKEHYGRQLEREKNKKKDMAAKRTLLDSNPKNKVRDVLICIILFSSTLFITLAHRSNLDDLKEPIRKR